MTTAVAKPILVMERPGKKPKVISLKVKVTNGPTKPYNPKARKAS